MSTEVSFCPLCAGKLDSQKDDRFVCDDCETHFFIQVVDEVDDEDDDDDDADDDSDADDDEEEVEDEDEY